MLAYLCGIFLYSIYILGQVAVAEFIHLYPLYLFEAGHKLTTGSQLPMLPSATKTLAPTQFSWPTHWMNTVGANIGLNVWSQDKNKD